MSDYISVISVQEVIEKINERAREMFSFAPGYEHYLNALHDVTNDLEQMPTIDVVPAKPGEWIIEHFFTEGNGVDIPFCTACGKPNKFPQKTAFCPNCGAKMDGERRT